MATCGLLENCTDVEKVGTGVSVSGESVAKESVEKSVASDDVDTDDVVMKGDEELLMAARLGRA